LFTRAARDNLAVFNAAVYGGGLLTPSGGNGTYAYQRERDAVREAAVATGVGDFPVCPGLLLAVGAPVEGRLAERSGSRSRSTWGWAPRLIRPGS
jgi:hypothetical protein